MTFDAAFGQRRQRLGVEVGAGVPEPELAQRDGDLAGATAEIDHEATRRMLVEQGDELGVARARLVVEVVLHADSASARRW